jgi:two-component system LytT family response regulator
MNLRSLVIDDEEIATRGLERYLNDIPFIQLEAIFNSSVQAVEFLEKASVDLIFLDIQMPKLTGLELIKRLDPPPMAIITTAYPDFALEGFELDVLDYLVKPFSFERLLKACNKAKDYLELKTGLNTADNYFFIKTDNKIERVEIDEILFVEAKENYVSIYTTKRKYLTLVSLKTMENTLGPVHFIKAQKSFLVAKDKIEALEGNNICIGNHKIPISRKWKSDILQAVLSRKLLRR